MRKSTAALLLIFSLPLGAFLFGGCSGQTLTPQMDGGGDGGVTAVTVPGCTGTCQVRTDCPASSGPTTITGVVNIPAGNLPLYNAKVYIPNGTSLPPSPASGATCDRCDSFPAVVAGTNTDINGNFTLVNVPSGQNIPLIVSVGKWQRVVTLPPITDCTTTTLTPDQTRLPRNHSEGNIPKIALSTGAADAMECLLRSKKLGLDDAEFTLPSGSGRVNLYAGGGYTLNGTTHTATSRYAAGFNGNAAAASLTPSSPWWDQLSNWSAYDIVILSCEGNQNDTTKSTNAKMAMESYLNAGGRVFASHWHNDWIANGTAALKSVANINVMLTGPDPTTDTIDVSFPKGMALANWLMLPAVGGSTTQGQIPVVQARYTISSIAASAPILAQQWVSGQTATPTTTVPQYFSFNTPVGSSSDMQCGEMVFTDLHVSAGTGGANMDSGGPDFPSGCNATSLTPQEKALIFLLFDLTNCLAPVIG